ncbi:MAG: MATE family efflux transporter [Candidatus Riflebacteria bacterium]
MQHSDSEIFKRVFKISLPAMAGFLGLILFDIIDIYWIEKIGTKAVAGVASAGFIVWSLYALMQITGAGCASLVAQFEGAGKRRYAWQAVVQSSWLSVIISGFLSVLLIPLIRYPFTWMGLEPYTLEMAADYFLIILYGLPLIFLDMLSGNVFNAFGDNRLSNAIMVVCLVLNMILDPLLMFGWYGFPAMGTEGAALATIISHGLSFFMRLYLLRRKGYIPPLPQFFKFKTFYFGRIIKVGLPNALTSMIWSLVYPFLARLITPFGMTPLSAIGICHRLESVPFFTSTAFGIAMTSLVGNAIGRKAPEEVDKIVAAGLRLNTFILLPYILLFLLSPHWLLSFMTDDPALIGHGAEYLFIIGLMEVFLGWEMVLTGVFTGLGITFPAMLVTLPLTIARIPLAWLLAYRLGLGVNGIWWAISLSSLAKGTGLYLLYKHFRPQKTTGDEIL